MSLVILRNKNGQSPAAFDNDFQNTFTVPAHSEVALHSISLNRSNNYDISDRIIGIYHGPEMENGAAKDNGTTMQMPQSIKLENGSYTDGELASHIQVQLRSQDIHPNYQQNWTCSAKFNTGGVLQGYQLVCDQITPATSAPFPTAMTDSSSFDDVQYTAATGVVTTTNTTAEVFARTTKPLNLANGKLTYDFRNAVDISGSGVVENMFGIGRNYIPMHYVDDGLMDIMVSIAHSNKEGHLIGDVLIHQANYNNSSEDWEFHEVDYWDDSSYTHTGSGVRLNILGKTHTGFQFRFSNERVRIYLGDVDGDKWDTVLATEDTLKPTSFANCAAYPKLLVVPNKDVVVQASLVNNYVSDYEQEDVPWTQLPTSLQQMFLAADIVIDLYLSITNTLVPRGLQGTTNFIPYVCTLLLGHSSYNMDALLGYNPEVTVIPTTSSSTITFDPTDTTTPALQYNLGNNITFVRCPTLTQRSLNGVSRSMSSILCDVPRYAGGSLEQNSGRVFYVPAEKTYLKLNNTEPLTLNRVMIELVNANEQLVSDLIGDTTVVLHIKSCGCK
jgi:hypothetical protein